MGRCISGGAPPSEIPFILYNLKLHRGHAKFYQYRLVDHLGATFPAGFGKGLCSDLTSYDAEFDTTVILKTEFHENTNIFISHPNEHKRNWKIVYTINITYAPIQINWARTIASSYFRLELHRGLKCYGSSLWNTSLIVVYNLYDGSFKLHVPSEWWELMGTWIYPASLLKQIQHDKSWSMSIDDQLDINDKSTRLLHGDVMTFWGILFCESDPPKCFRFGIYIFLILVPYYSTNIFSIIVTS